MEMCVELVKRIQKSNWKYRKLCLFGATIPFYKQNYFADAWCLIKQKPNLKKKNLTKR